MKQSQLRGLCLNMSAKASHGTLTQALAYEYSFVLDTRHSRVRRFVHTSRIEESAQFQFCDGGNPGKRSESDAREFLSVPETSA